MAGIATDPTVGAYSIVLSGGYEDDEDHGDVIIYTGEGGRDPSSGKQILDQQLTKGNLALALSKERNAPVHVIRGANHMSEFSPKAGYRYAGDYYVTEYWHELGRSGHIVYRFRLENKLQQSSDSKQTEIPASERREYQSLRIIRDTKQSRKVKEMHGYKCQVCGIVLELPLGQKYAEAAHIKPLGRPHDGPDIVENILCLCPNHHVMFDNYVFSINPGLRLIGSVKGKLIISSEHQINTEFLKYHNERFFSN
jgi:putative restriction endonuclease